MKVNKIISTECINPNLRNINVQEHYLDQIEKLEVPIRRIMITKTPTKEKIIKRNSTEESPKINPTSNKIRIVLSKILALCSQKLLTGVTNHFNIAQIVHLRNWASNHKLCTKMANLSLNEMSIQLLIVNYNKKSASA